MLKIVLICVFLTYTIANSFEKNDGRLTLEELKDLQEVSGVLAEQGLARIQPGKLFDVAMHAMLSSIDSYSMYSNQAEMAVPTAYKYVGVGFVIDPAHLITIPRIGWTIANVWNMSPADRNNIKRGDQIIAIKNFSFKTGFLREESTENMTLQELREKLQGKPNSWITLKMGRCEETFNCTTFSVSLQREQITLPSIHVKHLEDTGYIWIREFVSRTESEVKMAVQDLITQHNIKRLIIDLRWCPGGLLQSAFEIASLFLRQHTAVCIEKTRNDRHLYFTNRDGPFIHLSIVVIVNNHTASAAEILAGALQDHQSVTTNKLYPIKLGAKLIGDRTFGKGIAQKTVDIDRIKTKYQFTYSKWTTPFGYDVGEKHGLEPDIPILPASWEVNQQLYNQYDSEYTFLAPQWSLDDKRDITLSTAINSFD